MPSSRRWLLLGLFCTTCSTLTIELLDTRLLSVITWYHLSFLAVSLAMLGMGAGAVHVYLRAADLTPEQVPRALARWSFLYAWSVLGSHLASMTVALSDRSGGANFVLSIAMLTGVLCVPFVLSGITVSIALTRVPGTTGWTYAIDLLGAATGCLAVLVLLSVADLTTAMELSAALAAVGAAAFAVWAHLPVVDALAAAAVSTVLAVLQVTGVFSLHVPMTKGRPYDAETVAWERWSLAGYVTVNKPAPIPPFYWQAGAGAPTEPVEQMVTVIDGGAGTTVTRWDGSAAQLEWIPYDLTVLPYHVVKGGDVAVIGVGGGRDVLAALWADSRSVVGVELNAAFVELHRERPDFSHLWTDPRVTLVKDEGRSWITASGRRFDVIQMSLIDTWAASSAGAFTLSENGLYTVEAFDTFLDHLTPSGVLSVSRWYTSETHAESTRLVSLATAALLRAGVERPRDHLLLATGDRLSTLIVAAAPLGPRLPTVRAALDRYGFRERLGPGHTDDPLLAQIADSRSPDDIDAAVAGQPLDLSPPTDDRPYFFNLVPLGTAAASTGATGGNVLASGVLLLTVTCSILALIALVAVPLARRGRPELPGPRFRAAIAYFALIGAGFMWIQLAFLQRLGPYLGEPIYAVALVLFAMIVASGVGSAVSDRVDVARTPRAQPVLAVVTCAAVVLTALVQPRFMAAEVAGALPVRAAVAIATVAPASLLLGVHFPLGLRTLGQGEGVAPWMWGINASAAVVASGLGVMISMQLGIGTTLLAGASCYLALAGAGYALTRRATR